MPIDGRGAVVGCVRALLASVLCASLVGPHAALSAQPAALNPGSPVVEEVWSLIDKYFLDRTFNGIDWPDVHRQIQAKSPLSEAEAVDEAERLVKRVGDKYSRVVGAAHIEHFGAARVGESVAMHRTAVFRVFPCAGAEVLGELRRNIKH